MSEFRAWVYQVWQDNCVEHEAFNELPFTQQEYWSRYKYWLKREFRYKKSLINQ